MLSLSLHFRTSHPKCWLSLQTFHTGNSNMRCRIFQPSTSLAPFSDDTWLSLHTPAAAASLTSYPAVQFGLFKHCSSHSNLSFYSFKPRKGSMSFCLCCVISSSVSSRFSCPCPGVFRCTLTGLVFGTVQEAELQYRTVQWDQSLLQPAGKMAAGPLFNIHSPDGAVSQLRLPHCETRDGKLIIVLCEIY